MTPSAASPRARRSGLVLLLVAVLAIIAVAMLRFRRGPETETVDKAGLEQRNGLIHRVGAEQPFTGVMIENYPDGTLKTRTAFKDGRMHGVCEGWHTNGVRQSSEKFQTGVSDGVRTQWYASGAKRSEALIVGGQMEGVFRAWHENGQLSEEIAMKHNRPDGEARTWYPSGFLKAALGTNLVGKIEHRNWKDGEVRSWPTTLPESP